ncbi:MAG: hypothetical protein ABII90_16240 [Bacteroidota bacterium]
MSNKYKIVLACIFSVLIACEPDFDVNAPWKDITIVYGLLNQNDSLHYVKINKAFLGNADAYEMAQIRDSSEYDVNDIEVKVERWKDGIKQSEEYTLNTTTIINKEAGDFYSPEQIIYYFITNEEWIINSQKYFLDQNSDYKLVIENTKTGKVVTATTPIINSGIWCSSSDCQPMPMANSKICLYNNDEYVTQKVAWKTVKNGKRYQLTMRFKYNETNLNTSYTKQDSIDWVFTSVKSNDLDGGEIMSKEIDGEPFYKFVASKISPVSYDNNVKRDNVSLDFIIDVAGDEFNTYLEVNEPSTGLIQEKPDYTNVKNDKGKDEIGIFSCRYYEIRSDKILNYDSARELESGKYTSGLGFNLL